MRNRFNVVAMLLLLSVGSYIAGAQGYKRHFHIHQTSLTSFVVTCDNGADPTMAGISTTKNEIQVSCGKYEPEKQ